MVNPDCNSLAFIVQWVIASGNTVNSRCKFQGFIGCNGTYYGEYLEVKSSSLPHWCVGPYATLGAIQCLVTMPIAAQYSAQQAPPMQVGIHTAE